MANSGYFPAPGAQNPSKYPFTRDNYKKYGEQAGWIYDPYTDTYKPDPNAKKELQQAQGLIPKDPSLTDTLLPIGAVVGTATLATEGGKKIGGLLGGLGGSSNPTITGTTQLANGNTVALLSDGTTKLINPVTGALQNAGTAGAIQGTEGTVGATVAQGLSGGASGGAGGGGGLIGAGADATGAAAITDPGMGAALSNAPTGLSLGGMATNAASMGALPVAGVVAGTALGAKGAYDLVKGNKPKGLIGQGGRVVLGMATGGLSELARASGIFNHESTREATAKKTKGLLGVGKDDATYQNYVQGMRKQYESAPTGPAYAGKYNTFDEYKKGGLIASDLTGVAGNIQAAGPEWAHLTQGQREKITQRAIDADLYYSDKGDVLVKDPAKFKQFVDEEMGRKKAEQTKPAPAQQQLSAERSKPAMGNVAQKAFKDLRG